MTEDNEDISRDKDLLTLCEVHLAPVSRTLMNRSAPPIYGAFKKNYLISFSGGIGVVCRNKHCVRCKCLCTLV